MKPANHTENHRDCCLIKNQNGKRQCVVVTRQRDGRMMPSAFKTETSVLAYTRNMSQSTSDSTQSYRILPSATPTVVVHGPAHANTGPGNTLNSRGAHNAGELARQKDCLYTALQQFDADLIVVNELENNGFGPRSAIRTLVDEFNARPGSPGNFTFVDPGVTYLGGGGIKVSIRYRTSKLQIAPGTTVQVLDDSKLAPDFLARSTLGRCSTEWTPAASSW